MKNEDSLNQFQKYFEEPILEIELLTHPGNNRNYKLQTTKGFYIIKKYTTFQKDNWNRGLREFETLTYLKNIGIEGLPIPIKFIKEDNIGIYSFLPGILRKPEQVNEQDILVASSFLAKLHNIHPESKASIPKERTACFSIQDYFKLIEDRIKNLSIYKDSSPLANELQNFLENKVIPLKENLMQELEKELTTEINNELPINEQVLTPGDYGFHNILIDETNQQKTYSFLDFEYFGRDDPVKQILDFLHHDRHKAIPQNLRNLFLTNYLEKTNRNEEFSKRLHLIDPLIGLNWTLIYLTPFTKDTYNQEDLLRTRLDKAKTKIENLRYLKSNHPSDLY
jgi:Ser/Thr protein kinase RdoA (MazF antagonist)